VKDKVAPDFAKLGLNLDSLRVQNISLPEELQKALDQRISLDLVGDMRRLTQYETARSIPIAAGNEGGAAGIGAGLGAGITAGQSMASAIAGANQTAVPGELATDLAALLQALYELMT